MIMKILDLPLKAKWYNMIESGIKAEEYREIKSFWIKRLLKIISVRFIYYIPIDTECADLYEEYKDLLKKDLKGGVLQFKDYTHVRFRYGYTKRTMLFEIKNIRIGEGISEWGAPTDEEVFIITLGNRL